MAIEASQLTKADNKAHLLQQNFSHQTQFDKLPLFRFVRPACVNVLPLLHVWIAKIEAFYFPHVLPGSILKKLLHTGNSFKVSAALRSR